MACRPLVYRMPRCRKQANSNDTDHSVQMDKTVWSMLLKYLASKLFSQLIC